MSCTVRRFLLAAVCNRSPAWNQGSIGVRHDPTVDDEEERRKAIQFIAWFKRRARCERIVPYGRVMRR
jgi:hypothetical protein